MIGFLLTFKWYNELSNWQQKDTFISGHYMPETFDYFHFSSLIVSTIIWPQRNIKQKLIPAIFKCHNCQFVTEVQQKQKIQISDVRQSSIFN